MGVIIQMDALKKAVTPEEAQAKWQHKSWPAQRRLSKFPRKDADCQDAGNDADDFGEHITLTPIDVV